MIETTALPTGWPHDEIGSVGEVAVRSVLPLIDSIARPLSRARSPRGFHTNGPGSGAAKRQVATSPAGSSTQAFPPATKATVCEPAAAPGEATRWEGLPVREDRARGAMAERWPELDGEPGLGPDGDVPVDEAFVQAASTTNVRATHRAVTRPGVMDRA